MNGPGQIVVLGEALVDVFPEREELGGAPFNVARNLAALGAAPVLVSRVGEDAAGERIAAQISRLGMTLHGLQRDSAKPTGRVLVTLDQGQPEFRIESDAAWDWLEPEAACGTVDAAQPRLVYFGSLAQRSEVSRAAIRFALAASSALRFLDLNLRVMPGQREVAEASLQLADVLKVNEAELAALLEWFAPQEARAANTSAFRLMDHFDLKRLVLTRGERGWVCFDSTTRRVLEGPAPEVKVRDTVGAGDAFAAVLLLGELRGWDAPTTLARAADFSAAVCTLHGAFEETSPIYRQTWDNWTRQEA